jgi:predicted ester cyclase
MAVDVTAIETNKALARRAIGYNHGATDDGAEIFSPDFLAYMPGQPPMERQTFEHFVAALTDSIPGYTYEIHDQIAQGDLVANRITWRGVHTIDLGSIPATGLAVELAGINMFQVKDGRVIAQWAQLDMFGLLQQLGAIPA